MQFKLNFDKTPQNESPEEAKKIQEQETQNPFGLTDEELAALDADDHLDQYRDRR